MKISSTLRFQQYRGRCRRWRRRWRKHWSPQPRPPRRPPAAPAARQATSWSRTLGRCCTLVSGEIQYPVLAVTLLTSPTPTHTRKLGFTDKKFNSNTVFIKHRHQHFVQKISSQSFIHKLFYWENTIRNNFILSKGVISFILYISSTGWYYIIIILSVQERDACTTYENI